MYQVRVNAMDPMLTDYTSVLQDLRCPVSHIATPTIPKDARKSGMCIRHVQHNSPVAIYLGMRSMAIASCGHIPVVVHITWSILSMLT